MMNYDSTSQLIKNKYFNRGMLINASAYLLALMFLYAGSAKLVIISQFREQMMESPLIPRVLIPILAWLIPISEIGFALLLMFEKTKKIGFYLSFFVMFIFALYLIALVTVAENAPCACGGILGTLGYTEHIIFNILFTLIALYGCIKMGDKSISNTQS